MDKLVLDVGSGSIGAYGHKFLKDPSVVHVDINREAYHVEVICDAHFLPFKDNVFSIVNVAHVLEHLENPLQALRDFKRVTNGIVVIQVPNPNYKEIVGEGAGHIYSWSKESLKQLLEKVFDNVTVHGYIRNHKGCVRKLKIWLLSSLCGHHSLIAYCRKAEREGKQHDDGRQSGKPNRKRVGMKIVYH